MCFHFKEFGPSTPFSDNSGEKKKKESSLALVVKHISTRHCYFSCAYLSMLSPLLQNTFLTKIASLHITVKNKNKTQ